MKHKIRSSSDARVNCFAAAVFPLQTVDCHDRGGLVSSQGSATAIRSAYEGLTALPREQAVSSPEALRRKCLARWG
jgi:hypothetical protein